MKYPKIHSLWKRNGWYFDEDIKKNPSHQKGRQSFIVGDYALPEFGNIKKWLVQEKIDGTNIRVKYPQFEVCGRNEDSNIPKEIIDHIVRVIRIQDKMYSIFPPQEDGTYPSVWLFGEGYGPKIQKGGGNYRKDAGFILFDVVINGSWLSQESVKDISEKLGIPYAPIIGIMTEQEIVEYVKLKPLSLCSVTPQEIEGVICRPEPLLLQRNGDPLMMKLKCKEF